MIVSARDFRANQGKYLSMVNSGERYDFYECKYYDRPMTRQECEQEREQLRHTKGIEVSGIGFVCTGGFDFCDTSEFLLIDGDSLYREFG